MTQKEADVAWIKAVIKTVENNPNFRKLAEAYQQRYGTFSPDDLQKRFTI
jgi:hypothetical protein